MVMNEVIEERHQDVIGEITMTGAQALIAQGRKEGRKEGREEGKRENLLEILQDKFGFSEEEAQATVQAIPASELSVAIRRAALVTTREEWERP